MNSVMDCGSFPVVVVVVFDLPRPLPPNAFREESWTVLMPGGVEEFKPGRKPLVFSFRSRALSRDVPRVDFFFTSTLALSRSLGTNSPGMRFAP